MAGDAAVGLATGVIAAGAAAAVGAGREVGGMRVAAGRGVVGIAVADAGCADWAGADVGRGVAGIRVAAGRGVVGIAVAGAGCAGWADAGAGRGVGMRVAAGRGVAGIAVAGGGGAIVGVGSGGMKTSVGAGGGVTIRATVCRIVRQVGRMRSATPASDAKPNNRLKRTGSYRHWERRGDRSCGPAPAAVQKTMRRLGRRLLRLIRSASKQSGRGPVAGRRCSSNYVRGDFVVEPDFERSPPSNVPPVDVVVPVEPLNDR